MWNVWRLKLFDAAPKKITKISTSWLTQPRAPYTGLCGGPLFMRAVRSARGRERPRNRGTGRVT